MTPRRRFCPRGHDTLQVGRDASYRCRRCKLDAKIASRRQASEVRLREAEAIAAEKAAVAAAEAVAALKAADRQRKEVERREQAERQRILDAGGDDALELLQREALEADRCGWYEDGTLPSACVPRAE